MSARTLLLLCAVACRASNTKLMVVTGASKGVGAAVARHYAAKPGWCVAALARDGDALERLAASAPDGALLPLACDVSDAASVSSAIELACARSSCGAVSVLVNNAAQYTNTPFADMSVADIDALVDVNLKGSMYATHAVLPGMLREGAGRVLFINSVAGLPTWTVPGETVYAGSKHGLSGFADALAHELKGTGVLCTSLHPGGIDTPLQVAAGTPADVRERFLREADVVATVEHVISSDPRVLYKRVEVFGSDFWH